MYRMLLPPGSYNTTVFILSESGFKFRYDWFLSRKPSLARQWITQVHGKYEGGKGGVQVRSAVLTAIKVLVDGSCIASGLPCRIPCFAFDVYLVSVKFVSERSADGPTILRRSC